MGETRDDVAANAGTRYADQRCESVGDKAEAQQPYHEPHEAAGHASPRHLKSRRRSRGSGMSGARKRRHRTG